MHVFQSASHFYIKGMPIITAHLRKDNSRGRDKNKQKKTWTKTINGTENQIKVIVNIIKDRRKDYLFMKPKWDLIEKEIRTIFNFGN